MRMQGGSANFPGCVRVTSLARGAPRRAQAYAFQIRKYKKVSGIRGRTFFINFLATLTDLK